MRFRRLAPVGCCALLACARVAGHDEWHNLHILYSAKTEYVYPFDGRTPKVAVALLNHYPVSSAEVVFSLNVNGQRQDAGAFASFPNGGSIAIAPDDFALATTWTGGVYEGRVGAAPAVGETKEISFQWNFALAPGVAEPPRLTPPQAPAPGDTNTDPPGVVNAKVKFTNLGDNPVLTGPMVLAGTLRVPRTNDGRPASGVTVEVATPHSNWWRVPTTAADEGRIFAFSQNVPERADWHVRLSADGYETRVVAIGSPFEPRSAIDLTLTPAPTLALDYRRITTVATPTGFWRGAVAESEGTFAAFPGQENWKVGATDAESRAIRSEGRIYKYKFDGTKIWEHAPGWEVWGGDMSPDGRYVAYVPNPTVHRFYTPPENKLVLLDGATGNVIWTKAAPPNDAVLGRKLEALEVAFSPDARWIAVGSTGGGQVTLVERATGNVVWSVPGRAPTFGQVRKLRFSGDAQFLYCGSGDSYLRKLRVSDGAVLWRTFVGGWPFVNGLDIANDGAWIATGAKSLDTALVRARDGFQVWLAESQAVDAVFSSDGRYVASFGGHVYRTTDGVLAGMAKVLGVSRFTPDGKYLLKFDRNFALHDLGGKRLRDFGETGIGAVSGEQTQWAHVTANGRYAVVLARDMASPPQTGIVIFERQPVANPVAPFVTIQPLAQTIGTGTSATLMVAAEGSGPLAYQWRKGGVDLPGANSAVLVIPAATPADAGSYTSTVTNAAGAATSAAAAVGVATAAATNPARLANLAVRTTAGPGAPLIVGFVVGGAGTAGNKPLLLRGVGPSLGALGVAGALADPQLALYRDATRLAGNDNWDGDGAVAALEARLGAFALASPTSRDAALAALPETGGYTVQVSSGDATSGTALAEIYDASTAFSATEPRLINVSARSEVGGANGALIAGFVIAGPVARTVLVRAIGPGLAQFGVRGVLADPRLTLFSGSTVLAATDQWYETPNAVALAAAAQQVGAFRLPADTADAGLLLTLPPGSYTAQVSGADGASGTALVEVYEVP